MGEFEYDTHNLNNYSSSSGYSSLVMLSSCASLNTMCLDI